MVYVFERLPMIGRGRFVLMDDPYNDPAMGRIVWNLG
jgi:hypothetical protein